MGIKEHDHPPCDKQQAHRMTSGNNNDNDTTLRIHQLQQQLGTLMNRISILEENMSKWDCGVNKHKDGSSIENNENNDGIENTESIENSKNGDNNAISIIPMNVHG